VSISETYHYDEAEDRLHIHRVSDAQPIIEANKRAFNDAGSFKSEVFNLKARIDPIHLEGWLRMKGISYQEFMSSEKLLKRFLNDPDNKFCLTRKGKI